MCSRFPSCVTDTSTQPATDHHGDSGPGSPLRELLSRITRFEIIVGAVIAAIMLVLVLIEPDILEAPFENERTLLFTFGGTALAALAYLVMLRMRVPPVIRVVVLVVPFVLVNWWLISPYFIDDVVDEDFSTSISEQVETVDDAPVAAPSPTAAEVVPEDPEEAGEPIETAPAAADEPADAPPPPPPSGPVLLGAGPFVGLAGHDGTGDAGIFQNPDGTLVLRFENFDIENGPDLEVYLVPGADQVSLPEGSVHLGELKGNIGDQNYELPSGVALGPGTYTVLVWCEAFSVEFVGATITV